MKKISKIIVISFVSLLINQVYAVVLPEQHATGKVLRTEKDSIIVLDRFNQKLSIPRTDVLSPKDKDWVVGEKVTFRLTFKDIDKEPLQMPTASEWKNMSYADKEKVWLSIYRFHKMIEEKSLKRDPKHNQVKEGNQTTPDTTWINFLLDNATATTPANGCFYAGWPSTFQKAPTSATEVSTQCRAAWTTSASGYHNCGGGDNVFRCNPDLFGPGSKHTGAGSLGSAGRPFPSCTVETFPTKSYENGICVKVNGNESILKNCYEAALMNIPKFINRPEYGETLRRIGPQIVQFCKEPDLPSGVAEAQRETVTAAILQDRQQECQYLKAQLASLEFHIKKPERRCVVVSSDVPTGDADAAASCHALKVICIRGNVTYQGFIGKKEYKQMVKDTITVVETMNDASDARLRINNLRSVCGSEQPNCYDKPFLLPAPGHLYEKACSEKSSEVVDNYAQCEPYQFEQQQLGETFRGSKADGNCSGDYCVVNGRCARPGVSATDRATFMEVTAVCRCHTLAPYLIADNLSACLSSGGDIQGITATPEGQDFKPFTDGTSTVIPR